MGGTRSPVNASPPQWGAMVGNLVAPQVPLVLAHLVALGTLDAATRCVDVDDVLFQIELVAEHSLADGADAWLTAVPQLACHQ